MSDMEVIEIVKGDIDRLRETVQNIFDRVVEEKNSTNLFDTGSYHTIIQNLHSIKYGRSRQSEETVVSKEIAYVSGVICLLREVLDQLLLEAFCNEPNMAYYYENYNWLYFGVHCSSCKLDNKTIRYEPELETIKKDIKYMQDTVYQLLGVVFSQETEAESIFENYNWMNYAKRYNKFWLNENGEPHSEDDFEETHYFEYQYHKDDPSITLKI